MSAFTTADDALIVAHYATMTLHAIAKLLDRAYGCVQARAHRLAQRGVLDVTTRHYGRPWTEEQEEYLAENWGVRSDATVEKRLRRSHVAVVLKAKRLGLTRRSNVWSATDVGALFGVHLKTVVAWVERGWIKGKKAPFGAGGQRGEYRAWSIDEDSVESFVRRMGWAYDWRRMTEGEYLTRLARKIDQADPWLTLPACARALGMARETMHRWTGEGLAHQHRPKQSAHGPIEGIIVVRRSELLAFRDRHEAAARLNRSAGAKLRCMRQAEQRQRIVA